MTNVGGDFNQKHISGKKVELFCVFLSVACMVMCVLYDVPWLHLANSQT